MHVCMKNNVETTIADKICPCANYLNAREKDKSNKET